MPPFITATQTLLQPSEILKRTYATDWESIQEYEKAGKTAIIIEMHGGTPFIHRLVKGRFEVDGISPEDLRTQDFMGGEPAFISSVETLLTAREVGQPYILLPKQPSKPLTFKGAVKALRSQRALTKKVIASLPALVPKAPKPRTFDPFDL